MRNVLRFSKVVSGFLSASVLASMGVLADWVQPRPLYSAEEIRINVTGPLVSQLSIDDLATFAETGEITGDFKLYARFLDEPTQLLLRQALQTRLPLDVVTVSHLSYSPLGRDAIENVGKIIRIHPEVNGFYALRAAVINAAAKSGPEGWTVIDAMREFPTQSIVVNVQDLLALRRELSIYFSYNQAALRAIQAEAAAEAATEASVNPASLPDLSQPGPYSFQRSTLTVTNPALRQTSAGLTVNYDFPVDIYLPQGLNRPAPVVIVSHGFGAVKEDFVFLAEHLASYGYAVMVPEHVGSDLSYRQTYFQGRLNTLLSPVEFVNRPQEISFLIDQLEDLVASSPEWAARVNLDQIAVVGDSLGSTTALALAGADIHYARITEACNQDNVLLNFALYLECRARFLPPRNYDLADARIKAVVAAHPLGGFLYGPEGVGKISIPLLMVSGSNDVVSPVVTEQIHPFVWLQTPHKYLALLQKGTHFSSKPPGEGVDDAPSVFVGEHRDVGSTYYKILSLAFLEAYLRGQEDFLPYLSARYADAISEGQPMTVDIIQSLTADQLVAASGGRTPVPVVPPPIVATPEPRAESILAEIERTGILKVAMRRDAAPFGYLDAQGQWTGYCPALVDALRDHLTEELGQTLDIELVELPSTLHNRFDLVKQGDAYLECGPNTLRTDVAGVQFSNVIFASGTQYLTPAGNPANINPFQNLPNVRLGVLKDSTTESFLSETHAEAAIVTFDGPAGRAEAVQALNQGQIDAYVGDGILTYAELVRQGLPLNQYAFLPELPLTCDFYGLILPDDDPAWATLVDRFINSETEETIGKTWLTTDSHYNLNQTAYCLNR